MRTTTKVLMFGVLCAWCLAPHVGAAENAKPALSIEESRSVLAKLKTAGTIKQYKLDPGENKLFKLDLSGSGITDLTVLKGMPLELLRIDGGDQDPVKVKTLAGLEGMPLKELSLQGNVALADISAIKGAPLKVLKISGTHHGAPTVTDLSPLAGMALETVVLSAANKDVNVLKGMPLKSVYLAGAVTDISALKGLQLKSISFHGATQLVDLSPLIGMPLVGIDLFGTKPTDLSPLSGMPLKHLDVPGPVSDLSGLKDMPALESLNLGGSKVTDLSPLKAVKKLKTLALADWRASAVSDIKPLAGLPLESLNLANSKVTDISPLAECQNLTSVTTPATCKDLEPLRKVQSLKQINGQPIADFWKKYDEAKNKK